MKLTRIQGQPSWCFAENKVAAAVTRQGGHLAPVQFRLGRRTVEPFSIAPWSEEKSMGDLPPLLQSLRGDFFCAPFGGNEKAWHGEKHPAHGETANAIWQFDSLTKSAETTKLHLSLETKIRPGRVDKHILLRRGQTAVYCQHVLTGMSGRMNPGHHAMLKFPQPAGSGRISTSPVSFGQVLPVTFENPDQRGYSSLKPGAVFSRLDQVPAIDGSMADLSRYPARRGFEDLVMVTHEAKPDFAWTAVAFPDQRYVWFALKDPRVLCSTVFWISNGGRHYAPWNGRHVDVMGLEDVTAYFHLGLASSSQTNPVNRRGIPTSIVLNRKKPLIVNYIMAVAAIPRGFERVQAISHHAKGVTLHPDRGRPVEVPLDPSFLYSKPL